MPIRSRGDIFLTRGASAVGGVLLFAVSLLAACAQEPVETADTPSGLPIPRWVSVRGSPASMRAGPGLDYPILWRFERSGVPLQVITETREWRKVCGPDGSVAWIHRSLTSGRTRALAVRATEARARPDASSDVRARLALRASVGLEACETGWCQVRSGDVRGWVPEADLFGTAEEPLCRPETPATPGGLMAPAG